MPGPFTIKASDLLKNDTGTNISIIAVTQPPSGGSVFLSDDAQTITYILPPQNTDGTYPPSDSFTYTIQNKRGKQATATVTISLVGCTVKAQDDYITLDLCEVTKANDDTFGFNVCIQTPPPTPPPPPGPCGFELNYNFYNDTNPLVIGKGQFDPYKILAGDLLVYNIRQPYGTNVLNRLGFQDLAGGTHTQGNATYDAGYWIPTQADIDAMNANGHQVTTAGSNVKLSDFSTNNGVPMPGAPTQAQWTFVPGGSTYTAPLAQANGYGICIVYYNNANNDIYDASATCFAGGKIGKVDGSAVDGDGWNVFTAVVANPCGLVLL